MAAITEMKPKKIRLGDLLIANKVISQEQLNTALADQKKSGRKLGRVLVENGFLSEDQLLTFLSQQLNIPYIDLRRYHYKPEVVPLIPEAYARRFRAIVLEDSRENLLVGMADPTDIFAYDELSRVLDRRAGYSKDGRRIASLTTSCAGRCGWRWSRSPSCSRPSIASTGARRRSAIWRRNSIRN